MKPSQPSPEPPKTSGLSWRILLRTSTGEKVTKTISAAGINIGAARVTTSADLKAVQTFDLWVSDVGTLTAVMREIGRIRGVVTVERLRT